MFRSSTTTQAVGSSRQLFQRARQSRRPERVAGRGAGWRCSGNRFRSNAGRFGALRIACIGVWHVCLQLQTLKRQQLELSFAVGERQGS